MDFCTFCLGVPSYHRKEGQNTLKTRASPFVPVAIPIHSPTRWRALATLATRGLSFFFFLSRTSLSALPEAEVKTRCYDATLGGKWTKGQLDAQEPTRKENQRKLAPSLGRVQVQ